MSIVLRQLHTLNSAANLLELEPQRSLILTHISAIVYKCLIPFPWQWKTNLVTNKQSPTRTSQLILNVEKNEYVAIWNILHGKYNTHTTR